MKTKELTKGPWSMGNVTQFYKPIIQKDHPKYDYIIKHGLDKSMECISIGTKDGQVALIPLDESNHKNALLIAAAPEMLQTLETAKNGLLQMNTNNQFMNTLNLIDSVIRKAHGKS